LAVVYFSSKVFKNDYSFIKNKQQQQQKKTRTQTKTNKQKTLKQILRVLSK